MSGAPGDENHDRSSAARLYTQPGRRDTPALKPA